jgi:RimJ/RimL family protein N-acetyltransferase
MTLTLSTCEVRSWRASDVPSLVLHANNRRIAEQLRTDFLTRTRPATGAASFRRVRAERPEAAFAIAVSGEAVGGIGFVLQPDVERVSAEIGYWLGEPFWGRGIVTEALVAVTRYALETRGLTRVFAVPFATNAASCRVLEKAGYTLEGRLRRSAIKDGAIIDQFAVRLYRAGLTGGGSFGASSVLISNCRKRP